MLCDLVSTSSHCEVDVRVVSSVRNIENGNSQLEHEKVCFKNTVTCPFHAAKFDITSGKKTGEPVLEIPPGMEPLSTTWQKYMESVGKEMSYIKTYDQETYEVKVEGDSIKVRA